MHLGLTYSATCQIYWVIWDFPILSPDRDSLGFAPKKLIELSKICSVKCNEVQLDPFCAEVSRLILAIKKIYGRLGWTNKMRYPGSV